MSEFAEMPHDPAPPETRRIVPEAPLLVRGLALAGVAVAAVWVARAAVRTSWLLSPLAAGLGAVGVLSAWSAAIHLTGGQKFDDHPFV